MGFDVLYLPPIHPIGSSQRRGPNNRPSAHAADPGSPWAIGSAAGGHKAIEPRLGTLEDFQRLLARAEELGIEIALDIAYQCSPDPVSYTHLTDPRRCARKLSEQLRQNESFTQAWNRLAREHVPVSYTHLDVYKRQSAS